MIVGDARMSKTALEGDTRQAESGLACIFPHKRSPRAQFFLLSSTLPIDSSRLYKIFMIFYSYSGILSVCCGVLITTLRYRGAETTILRGFHKSWPSTFSVTRAASEEPYIPISFNQILFSQKSVDSFFW